MATAKISLTARESQLRSLLLDVARYIDESREIRETIELRFAGGWVRDKLLDIESHDIDIAINAMTGHAFSLKMREYLDDEANLRKHSLEAKDIGSLHKILANPEKSKHLETVTTKLFAFDLDFVNLRKETYSADSRNPQMEFGTAIEDADRRDATINALFYNLHRDQVEDFVGGLQDLKDKKIRTPMEPEQTFKDDPLRVLRLVRFASRLGFEIDPATEEWMGDPSVMKALRLKISRERIGTEVEKMLKGNDPLSALQYFDRLGLYSTVFTDPNMKDIPTPSTTQWSTVYNCLQTLKSNETPGSIYYALVRSDDSKYISWILAALAPWSAIPSIEQTGAKAPPLFGTRVVQEGIKANSKVCSVVNGAFKNYVQITHLKDSVINGDAFTHQRDTVGMRIRKWDADGGNWRIQALFALLVEVMERTGAEGISTDTIFSEWQGLINHLEKMDVMDAPSEKPLVNGTMLMQELNAKGGIWTKAALDICMAWQLGNPNVRGVEGQMTAIEEVRKRSEELRIPTRK